MKNILFFITHKTLDMEIIKNIYFKSIFIFINKYSSSNYLNMVFLIPFFLITE